MVISPASVPVRMRRPWTSGWLVTVEEFWQIFHRLIGPKHLFISACSAPRTNPSCTILKAFPTLAGTPNSQRHQRRCAQQDLCWHECEAQLNDVWPNTPTFIFRGLPQPCAEGLAGHGFGQDWSASPGAAPLGNQVAT